jgi:Primase C terminal 1 (PriCT-1)
MVTVRGLFIEIDGMKIDVKGLGGLVVAPPSTRIMADGPVRTYQFLEGGWEWVETLPRIKAGALPKGFYRSQFSDGAPLTDRVGIGQRNVALFNSLLRLAKTSRTRDELLQEAIAINDGFTEPFKGGRLKRLLDRFGVTRLRAGLSVRLPPKSKFRRRL